MEDMEKLLGSSFENSSGLLRHPLGNWTHQIPYRRHKFYYDNKSDLSMVVRSEI
jgi:hypothetical protein